MTVTDPYCTVVIPTKNAMPLFKKVLPAVLSQRVPWRFEVLVIDSGSKDGSDTYAEGQPNTRVIRIPPSEFGHGRTRNFAISNSTAPFIAMLTHDAPPINRDWLVNLLAPLEKDDRIAGAFGRHIAWPDASPFTAYNLEKHFSGFLDYPLVVNRDTDIRRYETDEGWRQFLHFFSDNNACLRRAAWKQTPYPEVDFAEDQAWARVIIQNGWSKAYAPDAVVYHSHDYGPLEQLQRAFDESRSFQRDFGYNLSPRFILAVRSLLGLTYRDFHYVWRNKKLLRNWKLLPRQIILNMMLVSGHYLGNRHQKLRPSLQDALSRDRQVFLGRKFKN